MTKFLILFAVNIIVHNNVTIFQYKVSSMVATNVLCGPSIDLKAIKYFLFCSKGITHFEMFVFLLTMHELKSKFEALYLGELCQLCGKELASFWDFRQSRIYPLRKYIINSENLFTVDKKWHRKARIFYENKKLHLTSSKFLSILGASVL